MEILGRINAGTGHVRSLASVATGAVGVPAGVSAFDSGAHIYYLYADDGSGTKLYAVNVRTRSVTASGVVAAVPSAIQFDRATGKLYGETYLGTFPSGAEIVGQIDTGTGALTPVATVASGSVGVPAGVSAFDPVTGRYFLYADDGSGMKLYAVNVGTSAVTATGAVAAVPAAMQYDRIEHVLFGEIYTGGAEIVGQIDTGTGAVTPVATVATGSVGVPAGVSAFDPVTHLFFLYADDGSGMKLYTVNVMTTVVTATGVVAAVPAAMESGQQ